MSGGRGAGAPLHHQQQQRPQMGSTNGAGSHPSLYAAGGGHPHGPRQHGPALGSSPGQHQMPMGQPRPGQNHQGAPGPPLLPGGPPPPGFLRGPGPGGSAQLMHIPGMPPHGFGPSPPRGFPLMGHMLPGMRPPPMPGVRSPPYPAGPEFPA